MKSIQDKVALLAKIAENYDDMAPRLVYADWVEEFEEDHAYAKAIRYLTEVPFNPAWMFDEFDDEIPADKKLEKKRRKHDTFTQTTHARLQKALEHFQHPRYATKYGFLENMTTSFFMWRTQGPRLVTKQPIAWVRFADRFGYSSSNQWILVLTKADGSQMVRSREEWNGDSRWHRSIPLDMFHDDKGVTHQETIRCPNTAVVSGGGMIEGEITRLKFRSSDSMHLWISRNAIAWARAEASK